MTEINELSHTLEIASHDTIKACCAAFYASDWASVLLGESHHPGGLELTERLGNKLQLRPEVHLLDVASGRGASALFLAERFGCHVTGVDYTPQLVASVKDRAAMAGLSHLVCFERADAEELPFEDQSFDAILCECSFCTFSSKPKAAAEFARLLRPGGRLGLSDLTRSGSLPQELNTLFTWVACIADARPLQDYIEMISNAGLKVTDTENHDRALADMVQEIRHKLFGAELLHNLGKLDLPQKLDLDFDEAGCLARLTAEAVNSGVLGYALLLAVKP
jgi:ubiquinone/menaquinone biosynthesis C-methylase UbiE